MNNNINIEISKRVKTLRKLMKIKLTDFAIEVGQHQSNYSKMENGYAKMPIHILNLIEDKFYVWRTKEIENLKNRINYLESL